MLLGLAVCACQTAPTGLAHDAPAYELIPAQSQDAQIDYQIGALDVLAITVFKEPDLSFPQIQVDASGNVLFPLIGNVRATGKSPNQLAAELAARLNDRFLRFAQVSVVVQTSASQRVTIEGNVNEPGVYPISGQATLLQAIALAKSPTRVARLNEVVIFRFVDGERRGAVFNLVDIRAGKAPDPAIKGGDMVVVGFSAIKGAFRDFLTTAPFFSLFRGF